MSEDSLLSTSPSGSRAVDYYDPAGRLPSDDAILAKLAMRSSLTPDSARLVLAMVGLPARGKSFISHKLQAFLQWSGQRTQIFNAGQKRRLEPAAEQAPESGATAEERSRAAASFFDPNDPAAKAAREEIAMSTLDELLAWFEEGGEIGIYDATNSTVTRRRAVCERAAAHSARTGETVAVVFIESVCDEAALLEANMLAKVRASPDFKGLSEAAALADLRERIGHYERAYETVEDHEGAYIKLYNLSSKVCANQVFGRMSTRVLPYLTALHIRERPVYLAALLPGDSGAAGQRSFDSFAQKIAAWVAAEHAGGGLRLLSSTQPAALAAAASVQAGVQAGGGGGAAAPFVSATHQSGLNPIDRGATQADEREGLLARMHFHERFRGGGAPGGESFADLVRRLEPCVLEVEASMRPVLVLAHSGPCRALRAYFMGCDVARCMGAATSPGACALADEAHKLVELHPTVGGGWAERVINLETVVP